MKQAQGEDAEEAFIDGVITSGRCQDYENNWGLSEKKKSPEKGYSLYYQGRCALASNDAHMAKGHFQQALKHRNDFVEALFWLGVTHWALLEFENERIHYEKALHLNPDHTPSLLYLGHHYLDQGEWQKAIQLYQKVLKIKPDQATAMYNLSLAYARQGDTSAEEKILQRYLDVYRSGEESIKALNRLNQKGNFSYRGIWINKRLFIIPAVSFESGSAEFSEEQFHKVENIAEILQKADAQTIFLVVYVEANEPLAKQRALRIKDLFQEKYRVLFQTSWFGEAETIRLNNKSIHLSASVKWIVQQEQ
ncbi:tetratricopeptide repeat protein [Desulfobacterales bacterium HSG17]|nr:tetratricopeptide repeat protein [Desulfobacterales bacterium HSG17]